MILLKVYVDCMPPDRTAGVPCSCVGRSG